MKKLLIGVLALFTLALEAEEFHESKKLACTVAVKNIASACFGQDTGRITFSVEGNTEPFKAILRSARSGSSFAPKKITGNPYQESFGFTCLPPDTYTLSFTSTTCSTLLTDIVVPEASEIVIDIGAITTACYGKENGSISFTVMGGTAPYRAKLINSQSEVVQRVPDIQAGVTTTIKDLPADRYRLVVTDSQRCRVTSKGIVVPQATHIAVQIGTVTPTLPGQATGSIPFTITGGTPRYTVQLFNGVSPDPVQTISDIKAGEQAIFKNLPQGTNYSIVVTDSHGCQETVSGIVVPSSPVVVKVVEPVTPTCFGDENGTIPFSVSGGTAPYTAHLFKLVDGIPQLVQTLSNIQEGVFETFMRLPEGTYSIIATDAQGVSGSIAGITVTTLPRIEVTPGPITPTQPGESTGSIGLTVAGGAAPYTVQLFDSSVTPPILMQTLIISKVGGTGLFTHLPASSNYSLVITDANGCTETVSGIVVTTTVLVITITQIKPVSFGDMNGAISFSVTGGTGPYSALVVNSRGQVVDTLSNIQPGTTVTAPDLSPDTYSLVLTDELGNQGSVTNILVPQLSPIFAHVDAITPSFPGVANGTISFTVHGGLAPYTAQLLNSLSQVVQTLSNIQADESVTFVNLPSGTYSIFITDSNGGVRRVTGIVVPTASCNQVIVNDPFLAFYNQNYFGI